MGARINGYEEDCRSQVRILRLPQALEIHPIAG